MKAESRESLQRVLGIIEGASFSANGRVQDALCVAVELLDDILNKDEGERKNE